MIHGQVSAAREAIIPLQVRGLTCDLNMSVAIDTGFSGYLTLSPDRIDAVGMSFLGTAEYELANGREVTFRVYGGSVEWNGQWRDVHVLESDGGDLLGTRMLYGYLLTIDMRDGGAVTIEVSDE